MYTGERGHAWSPTRTTGAADRLARCRRCASWDWEGGDSRRQREVARTTTGWPCPAASAASSSRWASCRFMAMASAANDVRSLAQLFLGVAWGSHYGGGGRPRGTALLPSGPQGLCDALGVSAGPSAPQKPECQLGA